MPHPFEVRAAEQSIGRFAKQVCRAYNEVAETVDKRPVDGDEHELIHLAYRLKENGRFWYWRFINDNSWDFFRKQIKDQEAFYIHVRQRDRRRLIFTEVPVGAIPGQRVSWKKAALMLARAYAIRPYDGTEIGAWRRKSNAEKRAIIKGQCAKGVAKLAVAGGSPAIAE